MEYQYSNEISAAELKQKLSQSHSVNLIDVRQPIEYHTYNIGGDNIPLNVLSEHLEHLKYSKDKEIVVICQHGIRSETAQRLLVSSGYLFVKNLTGGLHAYRKTMA